MKLLSERITVIFSENPNLEQAELGRIAGTSRAMVNHWLSGEVKSINIEFALNIEESLHYSHIWLMLGRGEKKITKKEYSHRITHVLEILQNMEDYQVDQAVKIIDTINQPIPNGNNKTG